MCTAKNIAQASVSNSPIPKLQPCRLSSASPTVANTTANIVFRFSFFPNISQDITGVNTTNIPVMNPDTVAEAKRSPYVWVM